MTGSSYSYLLATSELPKYASETTQQKMFGQVLGLRPARKINVSGIGGFSYRADAYLVSLTIGEYAVYGIYVIGDKQNRAILGRDVINNLVVTLNGLALTLAISETV